MKLINIIILLLMATSTLAAVTPAPIIIMTSEETPAAGQGGCSPPIQFSLEHACTLRFSSKSSVNTFDCIIKDGRYYVIQGDCKGNAITYQLTGLTRLETFYVFLIVLGITAVFAMFIYWRINR